MTREFSECGPDCEKPHSDQSHIACVSDDHFVPQPSQMPAYPRRMGSGLWRDPAYAGSSLRESSEEVSSNKAEGLETV